MIEHKNYMEDKKPPFQIIFEDEYLLVVNKIAKLLIQPTPRKEKYTLTSLLEDHLKCRVYPCHRLDRETSGLIIYAKSVQLQDAVAEQFRRRTVKKKYIAFVKGILKVNRGIFEGRILDQEGRRFGEEPKQAKTLYRVLQKREGFSIVELEPLTGRTNQLRIQLAQAGHPILGEDKYAFRRDFDVRFKRLALHSFSLSFFHPVSRQKLHFNIDLPEDMRIFLQSREPQKSA